MREKSPRSNLRRRLLILRKKLERTASFPKKLFLGISPRRLILPPNSLRAAPFGAASKPLLPPTKNHEVQFVAPTRTRTWNPMLRRHVLYPIELWAPVYMPAARQNYTPLEN